MTRLENDLHSRILLGLAEVLADSRSKATTNEVEKLVSKCPIVPLDIPDDDNIYIRGSIPSVGTMTRRSQQTLTALVKYVTQATEERQLELLPRLLSYIRHLSVYDWEPVTLTRGPPPSDGITYSLVSGLLEISYKCPSVYERITSILWKYAEALMQQLSSNVEFTITFILPSLAGLSRALQLSPYLYRSNQLLILCTNTQSLIQDTVLEQIATSIQTCLKDHDVSGYGRRVLARYWEDGMPLSSNRVVYDLLIVLRNVTARVLAQADPSNNEPSTPSVLVGKTRKSHWTDTIDTAWSALMKKPFDTSNKNQELNHSLRSVYVMSSGYYEDVRKFAENQDQNDNKWATDGYMQEIMGTSLHVAALSSVYLHEMDDQLVDHISECLFTVPKIPDAWIQVAALDAAVLLSINFPYMNNNMINSISRFLATPSPVFELYASDISVQQYAVIRLAQCVQSKPQAQMSQAAISTLYALLNEITRYSGDDGNETGHHAISGAPAAEQLNEKQKQQVCTNALSAIVGVAVYLKDEAIMTQALSMLLLRRKSLSVASISSLTSRLVDLALVAPAKVFEDILNMFSNLSRESLAIDNKQLSSSIQNAMHDLAVRLSSRPEFYQTYFSSLLTLFVENGNAIQRIMAKDKKSSDLPLISKLGTLRPALQALLSHPDFEPHIGCSAETVSLFRNMWFLCVVFGFVTESMWIREWNESLQVIAKKTPVLVIESATNYLESDLEYNSVLRGGSVDMDVGTMRQKLLMVLPSLSYDVKTFSYAQLVFALSVYHVEMMRSKMGDCSFVLRYFMNDGVSTSSLANCLETIAERVANAFTKDSANKAATQTLEGDLRKQVAVLLELCCHRLSKVHQLAIKTTDRIVTSFPQAFADKHLITLLLELVQLLWLSCEAEYRDEYSPVYQFSSSRLPGGITIELGDSFTYRKEICTQFYESARKWLHLAVDRAPLEISGLLQSYLAGFDRFSSNTPLDVGHLGRSLALDVGKATTKNHHSNEFIPKVPSIHPDIASSFVSGFTSRRFYAGEISGVEYLYDLNEQPGNSGSDAMEKQVGYVLKALETLAEDIKQTRDVSVERLNSTLHRAAGFTIALPHVHPDLIRYLVRIPVLLFTPESLELGTSVWTWILVERPEIENRLMVEMLGMWSWAQRHRKGLFSPVLNVKHPFVSKMTYAPSDKAIRDNTIRVASFLFSPHVTWIKFLSSRFYAIRHRSKHLVNMFIRLLQESFQNAHLMSTHSLACYSRFQLLRLGLKMLQSCRMEALAEHKFRSLVYDAAFNWFSLTPKWHYGSRKSQALMLYKLLNDFYTAISNDTPNLSYLVTSSPLKNNATSTSKIGAGLYMFLNDKTKDDVIRQHHLAKKLLMLFVESELTRLSVWCNPLNATGHGLPSVFTGNTERSLVMEDSWKEMIRFAWEVSPRLAVQMDTRFVLPVVHRELHRLIANNSLDVVDVPEALIILLGDRLVPNAKLDLKYLQYWAPVPAITAANYFLPAFNNHPLILQYAMRSLEYYPVDTVFFYIPQIVQALRYDEMGYVEKYIMEAGQVSQLFAHQLIWNMKANFFVDADKDCLKPDALKPTLERVIDNLVASFTGADRAFYEREFKFFNEVTGISGYLKEYIKYGQTEKKPMQKKRLDEELAKVQVDVGVYLPSNPDGHVVDINRTSGRPLQSHAKAPFMATFKVEKEVEDTEKMRQALMRGEQGVVHKQTIQTWQGAIFKVGDDCRQDVLALQLIAVFKNIFTSVGLDLYVYPYRVVATAPGNGVIDVLPNSISRDQLGRERVNSLFDYFVAKYGSPDSIAFQRARINFVQSVAAYSLISYLLQFKDRHNGNIMLDDDGHIIHIDFGFIFDIAPGGGILESSPFKLTAEMIQVMGGGSQEQAFKHFSELMIKSYLACRPYAEYIMQLVTLMLESGLPCFKGETIKRMRSRFQVDKTERQASDFIMMRIRDSFENQRTVLYDYFQKLTNGIPY
ncbi:uncharacterized protein BX664DRAFT_326316 [Halteromyces radiatus]|uniref:uncharacterized protein n=1 Tax=Halteromyces radiatus TaxID=101107 RepID=UPI002220CC55|nr:uncharacterized protein BX664DRAFT_326316 [Halteromyces radiatus]KAI8097412.1 hypothetical protein BX664DRAFT_326316 [Halteromyces radiatus]